MSSIGKNKVLFSNSFILGKDEDLWIEVPAPSWNPKFHILFKENQVGQAIKVTCTAKGDHAEIIVPFLAGGIAGTHPINVAFSDEKPIQFQSFVNCTGPVLIFTIQFVLLENGEK